MNSLGLNPHTQIQVEFTPVGVQSPGGDWRSVGASWACLASQCMAAVCWNEEFLYFDFLLSPKEVSSFKVSLECWGIWSVLISDHMQDYGIKKWYVSSLSPLPAEISCGKSDAVSLEISSQWTFWLFIFSFFNTRETERKIKARIKIKISCWSWKRQHNCNRLEDCLVLEKVLIKIKFILSLHFDWT